TEGVEALITELEGAYLTQLVPSGLAAITVALLSCVKAGDDIEVSFNLRGRPWTDKAGKTSYFNSLVVWRINALTPAAAAAPSPQYAPPADLSSAPGEEDDLPF
ncbi:MAG: DUF3127 domain-containing protein, partial [Pedobacter sp.]